MFETAICLTLQCSKETLKSLICCLTYKTHRIDDEICCLTTDMMTGLPQCSKLPKFSAINFFFISLFYL